MLTVIESKHVHCKTYFLLCFLLTSEYAGATFILPKMNGETENKSYIQDKWPINYFANQYPAQLAPYQFLYNDMQNRAKEHQRLSNSYFHWEQGGGVLPPFDSYNVSPLALPHSSPNTSSDICQPLNYSMPMTSENSAPCNSLCYCTGMVTFTSHYSTIIS